MIDHQRDMTRVVDLPREKGTGAARTQRPICVNLLPPYDNACPAGADNQAWLAQAQARRWKEAWTQQISVHLLPAVQGRVCYHPCETSCKWRELDGAESIHAVERSLGDLALRNGWKVPVTAPLYECDNCLASCPEDAIGKLGAEQGYDINFEGCTGCAICVDQCRCHAMEMVGETVA